MTYRQLDLQDHRGESQPVAHMRLSPDEISRRCGIRFEEDRDDLDALQVAVVEAEGVRFVLQRYVRNPVAGAEIHALDAGDPLEQARLITRACELASEVDRWWDGRAWHEGPLPSHAA